MQFRTLSKTITFNKPDSDLNAVCKSTEQNVHRWLISSLTWSNLEGNSVNLQVFRNSLETYLEGEPVDSSLSALFVDSFGLSQ